jgi:cystathionine beta-lyase
VSGLTIFNEKINRFNTASVKWERTKEIFGAEDVLPMWVADMDFRPPRAVINKINDRAEHGIFGYTFVPESTAESICDWLRKQHNWSIHPEFLLYSTGVVASISTAIQAFTEPGDKVLLTSPVYTPFFDMIKLNGRTVINSPLVIKDGRHEIDFEHFEKELRSGCRLFLLCNPHNPGGRVWRKEELEKIGELCLQYNCLIVSDEIHSDIVYKPFKHVPIASLSPEFSKQTVTFIAPSKTFNLAGLQASAVIIENADLRSKFHGVQVRQGHFSLNTFGVIGMEAAYRNGREWLEGLLDYLQKNKQAAIDYLSEYLPMISCMDPEGTYLLWLDCKGVNLTDKELSQTLIHKGKVALEPGKKFGPGGEGFLRLNFGCPRDVLDDGLQRIRTALS